MPTTIVVTGVKAAIRDLEKVTERVIAKIALDVTANLKETTPVDTGWARSNWVPSVGAAFTGTIGSPSAVTSSGGEGAIAGYRLGQGSVFISNNVPYIGRLNEGYSSQAPAGFVQRAVEKAIRVDLGGVL